MRFESVEPQGKDHYNSYVSSFPRGDLLQSFEWGEAKRSTGWEPHRFQVTEAGAIVAACSVLTTRPVRGFPLIAYAPRGPVWSSEAALAFLTDGIKERFREAFALVCDPPIDTSEDLESLGFLPIASGGFGGIQPKAIMEVDLRDKSPDDLLAAFAQKWRYNVRLSGRKGVKVRSGSSKDLEVFYGLLTETSKRDGFPIRSFDYYVSVWGSLEPNSMAKMLLAENSGTAIAAVVLGAFGHRVTYLYGASSNADRNLMPNHLLHYEAIKWASGSGYWTYDLQGVSPLKNGEPTDESSAGLNRFKAGFGASYVEYVGELDLPLRPNWYGAWRRLYPTAAKVLRKVRTGL